MDELKDDKKSVKKRTSPLDTLKENKLEMWIRDVAFILIIFVLSCLMTPVFTFAVFLLLEFLLIRRFRAKVVRTCLRLVYWGLVIGVGLYGVYLDETNSKKNVEQTHIEQATEVERATHHHHPFVRLVSLSKLTDSQALVQVVRTLSERERELDREFKEALNDISEDEVRRFSKRHNLPRENALLMLQMQVRERFEQDASGVVAGVMLAIAKLTNQELLLDIVCDTNISMIARVYALFRITNQSMLIKIAKSSEDEDLRFCALQLLNDTKMLKEVMVGSLDEETRKEAKLALEFKKLNQFELYNIFKYDKDEDRRMLALMMISDQDLLADIALTEKERDPAAFALVKIKSQELLAKIAQRASNEVSRRFALLMLDDQQALEEIAKTDANPEFRIISAVKLENQQLGQAILEKIVTDGIPERPQLRNNAIWFITNKDFLEEKLEYTIDSDVREILEARLQELR
jgi:hypothetical protein